MIDSGCRYVFATWLLQDGSEEYAPNAPMSEVVGVAKGAEPHKCRFGSDLAERVTSLRVSLHLNLANGALKLGDTRAGSFFATWSPVDFGRQAIERAFHGKDVSAELAQSERMVLADNDADLRKHIDRLLRGEAQPAPAVAAPGCGTVFVPLPVISFPRSAVRIV